MAGAGRSISVRVRPRAHRDEVRPGADGCLEVRIAAAPVRGAANKRLVRILAEHLGVAPSRLRIVSGRGARLKRIAIKPRSG